MNDIPLFWIAIAIVVILIIVARRKRGPFRSGSGPHLGINVDKDLLKACHGDRAMAERLMNLELEKRPDLSQTGAALMALSRLRDDKR